MSTQTTPTATSTAPSEPFVSTSRVAERDLGLLVVRLVVGAVFVLHGSQKLFGAFGGQGIDGTAKFFASAGYSPATPLAVLAGLAEFGGGILLIIGLGASFAAAALVATMAGATSVTAQAAHGAFFKAGGGYEYELVLTAIALTLALTGAGRLSLDHGRIWDRTRVRFALAAGGVVVGLVTVFAH